MYENELKQLFTEEEYNQFLLFMIEKDYVWFGKENSYCLVLYIQEFISLSFEGQDFRLGEIIGICMQKYPQVLGLCEENI